MHAQVKLLMLANVFRDSVYIENIFVGVFTDHINGPCRAFIHAVWVTAQCK